ncbi:MAG: Rid family hydrolase [Gammaproteobacteria bacterium]
MSVRRAVFTVVAATVIWLVSPPAPAEHHEPEFFASSAAGDRDLPFSEAVKAGPFLYLSGMLGNRAGTPELAPGGIGPETFAAMEKIKAAVERHGSSMDRVIKCTVFLADISEWAAMNEVYGQFFPDNKPARSAVAVSGLALGARVEIACIAVVEDM